MDITDEEIVLYIRTKRLYRASRYSTSINDTVYEIIFLILIVATFGLALIYKKRPTNKSYIHPLFQYFDRFCLHPSFTFDGEYTDEFIELADRIAESNIETEDDESSYDSDESDDELDLTPNKRDLFNSLIITIQSFPDFKKNVRLSRELFELSVIALKDESLAQNLKDSVKKTRTHRSAIAAVKKWLKSIDEDDFKPL